MKHVLKFIGAHKIIAALIGLVVIYGGYRIYAGAASSSGATSYTLATVSRGTIISTVSGSGQIATTEQVNVTPQVSAPVVAVLVQNGQSVKVGQILARLDATDQIKAVNNAEASLQNAQIALQKLQEPPTTSTIAQSQYSLLQAQQSLQNASTTLARDYTNAYNAISSAYIDFPTIVNGLNDILFGLEANGKQQNVYVYHDAVAPYTSAVDGYQQGAVSGYNAAYASYNQSAAEYKNTDRLSSTSTIESVLSDTYSTAGEIASAVQNIKNYLDFVNTTLNNQGGASNIGTSYAKQLPSVFATQEANLQSYLTTINADLASLLGYENTLGSDKNALLAAGQNLATQQASYQELLAGPNPLDIQSDELSIEQAQNSLTDAQNTLADYTIRAPFDGVVANVGVSAGDNASAGTTIVTLITPEQYAEIPLNEVDVAKVALGQKATLTFDALPNLTIAGHVTQIDTLGTVSQGVVTYNVQVMLDTQNTSIKPGMSVSADIVTNVATDALEVPNAAIKTSGQASYVLLVSSSSIASTLADGSVLLNAAPETRTVTTGIANDTDTQILSGLNDGDRVIVRTVASSAGAQTTSNSTGGFGGLGGGHVFRIGG